MVGFAGTIVIDVKTPDWTVTAVLPVIEFEVAETVREPRARVVNCPPALTDATLRFDELQVTEEVIFFVL